MGFFKNKREAARLQKKYQEGWQPIDFIVKEFYIMSRESQDTPFEVRRVIQLGAAEVPADYQAHFEPKPLGGQ